MRGAGPLPYDAPEPTTLAVRRPEGDFMLDSMRAASKGWLAKLLLGILVVGFAIWGVPHDMIGNFTTKYLAKVGGQSITAPEFERNFNQALQNISRQSGQNVTLEQARSLGLDRSVLDNMIQTAALDAEAGKLKLAVGEATIVRDIMANPAFAGADGKFSQERFVRILEQNNLSEAGFLAQEKEARVRSMLTDAALAGLTMPRSFVEAEVRYRDEQRDASYFTFSLNAADLPQPAADDLKKQYEGNPAAYTAPEYRAVAIMQVDPAAIADKIQISAADLAAGYDAHKAEYFRPETRTVQQITFPDVAAAKAARDKINAGEDFLKVAEAQGQKESDITFADQPRTAFLDAAIADAAFALKPGEVSEPVAGSLTTALLRVAKITPEEQKNLEQVKDELTRTLQLEKARDQIQSTYDAVEDARASQTRFEDIASKAGLPFQLIPATSAAGQDKDGKDVTLPLRDELLKAVFASDVGVENDALTMGEGYVWYEVREVVPSALRPFDTVKDKVAADFTAAKLRELTAKKAADLVTRAETGTTLAALAQENNATVQKAEGVKRNEASAAFAGPAVAALFGAADKGFAWAPEPDGKGARVMQVDRVLLPAFNAASADTRKLGDEAVGGLSEDLLVSYLGALRNQVGVTINETLWRNVTGSTAAQ